MIFTLADNDASPSLLFREHIRVVHWGVFGMLSDLKLNFVYILI